MAQQLNEEKPDQQNSGLRILLVDDEPNIRDALCEYLMAIDDNEVVTAADAHNALERFSIGAFDCAFLDLKMPGMTGVELLVKLKEMDPSLPVVIMTGFPSLDAAIDTMRRGASDFLVKPFNLRQVKLTLERVVREQRLLRENYRLNERVRQNAKIEELNTQLRRRVREQSKIHSISEAIDRLNNSQDLYQGIADLCCQHLDARKAAVLLLDRSTDQLLVIAVKGFDQNSLGATAGVLGRGLCGKVAAEGQPMLCGEAGPTELAPPLAVEHNCLCLPIKIRDEVFGVLLTGDKMGGRPFTGDDVFMGCFLLNKAVLSIENIALYESMVSNMHSTLGALVGAMEAKDPYTRQHSRRVTNLSVLTAQTMGLSLDQIESIRFAAYLHDIGKIGVKDYILVKQSALSPEEFEHIKAHPVIGETIIMNMDLSSGERAIIRHHHERWDGNGYPDGLAGAEIPLLARIVAVADAFDAMTSDRPYRKAKSRDEATRELVRCRDKHFDSKVVDAFLEMLERYHPARPDDQQRWG